MPDLLTQRSSESSGDETHALRAAVESFVRGATRPSAGALIGTVLVAASLLAACVVFITPRNLARIDMGYIMDDSLDSYARLTGEVFRRKYEGFEDGSVILVGTSMIIHGFPPDEIVEGLIEEELGEPVSIVPFYADALSSWEVANLFGMFERLPDGVVVLGFNALSIRGADRLSKVRDNERLPFRSDAFEDELRLAGLDVPDSTGIYFIDYRSFFVARISSVRNLVRGPRTFVRKWDFSRANPGPEHWERVGRRLLEWLGDYDANVEDWLRVMGRTLDLIRSKGDIQIVILEPPLNPKALRELNRDGVLDRHARRMERFAREHSVTYWNVNDEADLRERDFADHYHLRASPSRERWVAILAARIADLLRDNATGGAS